MEFEGLRRLKSREAPVAVRWCRSIGFRQGSTIHDFRLFAGRLYQCAGSDDMERIGVGLGFMPEDCFVMSGQTWVPSAGPVLRVKRKAEGGAEKYSLETMAASLDTNDRFKTSPVLRVSLIDLERTAPTLIGLLGLPPGVSLDIGWQTEVRRRDFDIVRPMVQLNAGAVLQERLEVMGEQDLGLIGRENARAFMHAAQVLEEIDKGIAVPVDRLSEAVVGLRHGIKTELAALAAERGKWRQQRIFTLSMEKVAVDFVEMEARSVMAQENELSEFRL